jgi:hypothetical protein
MPHMKGFSRISINTNHFNSFNLWQKEIPKEIPGFFYLCRTEILNFYRPAKGIFF